MGSPPSVSIVIPCFNQAPFIGGGIESALASVTAPSEVMVVDDGSNDASADIARTYTGVHPAGMSGSPERMLRDMLAVTMQPPRATSTTGTPVLVSQRARSPMDAHVA